MPDLTPLVVTISHKLGKEEALRRVKRALRTGGSSTLRTRTTSGIPPRSPKS